VTQAVVVDPNSDAFRYDAMPLFQRLLREQPLTRLATGGVLLCRREDVEWALTSHDVRRPTQWSVNRKPEGPFREFGRNNMISMNPPDHTRFRQAIMPAFSRKRTEEMTAFVEQTCDALLDAMADKRECDFIADFAMPLPVTVICRLLGVPTTDEKLFRDGSAAMLAGLEITATKEEFERASAGARALFDFLHDVARARTRQPGDDLLSLLIENERTGRLTRDEVVWATITLLIAGHETTTHLIGNGLLALVRNPDQMALLTQNTTLAANAVEEFLRYDPPLYVLFREAATDTDVCGERVAAGTLLMLSIAAANRDPRVFADPDSLVLERANARDNLSFAAGRHLCAGHALARLEGRIAFSRIVERLRDIRLAAEPTPRAGVMFKGYHDMPIAYAPR
jgi:cytochrome P450